MNDKTQQGSYCFSIPIKAPHLSHLAWDNVVPNKCIKHEEECFIRFPNTEKWVGETRPNFLSQLRDVWKSDETLFRVFDMASQAIDNPWRDSKQKFTKLIYDSFNHISKPPSLE